MYGIPSDFDLTPLVGIKIILICRSFNTLSFDFANGWSITCDGPIEIHEENGAFSIEISDIWSPIEPLFSLLEKDIANWLIETQKSFRMCFTDITSILFSDTSNQYECFHISPRDWII